MCLICIDYFKGNLNIQEAKRNLNELLSSAESDSDIKHFTELGNKLREAELSNRGE